MDQPITPRDVLRQVAQAIPEDVRSDIIIVGSLAAAYQLLRDSDGSNAHIRRTGRDVARSVEPPG